MAVTLDDIAYQPPVEPTPVSFAEIFGNPHPVELEIGTGKGGFLLEAARAHPDRNYLGIEWARKYYRHAADRMARWGLSNVRMARADAKIFVMKYLPEASLAALHIYHPDPWPKRRHHKRRLIDPPFMDAAVRALTDGGSWFVQTDHQEYFGVIAELLSTCQALEQTLYPVENGPEGIVATNYQIKYAREGRPVYHLAFKRRARV